ncbi:MAG: Asp-tRNA(Asn)/Glu-tRNA(Gln) amidotransferase subunit GatC [Anaerolineae bacterium]|nr:Asp-tRNA(Asn)/Glu-tRNA(Gln) amidotransferase subunit GatC [Thermoflexales bacterium]MDW8395226.1 Asp-tRNA(Asn)/Glu-tRNA(Gln) amidotransferase subunit GatC [Anaerolineae bacterium]
MITVEEVERIALLARLALTPDEQVRFASQLSAILDYANALAAVDVHDVPPMATAAAAHNVMREGDQVAPSMSREDVLSNAPATDGAMFIVPATFGDDEA